MLSARLIAGMTICMNFLACSSGSSTFSSTIAGRQFIAASAVAGSSADGQTMFVLLTDYPSACEAASACSMVKGAQVVELALKNRTGVAGLGTYSATDASMKAVVTYLGCDAAGKRTDLGIVSGSVTITAGHDQGFDGSIDVSMNDGSKLSGNFTTSGCASLGSPAFNACAFGCPL